MMPRKVTAYGCKYRCGQRVNTKYEAMLEHESKCFYNPERRACATCRHLHYELEWEGEAFISWREWKEYYCQAGEDIDLSEKLSYN